MIGASAGNTGISALDVITGGEGSDTLIIDAAVGAAAAVGISGFEVLSIADGAAQDMAVWTKSDQASSWTTIQDTNETASANITLTNVNDSVTTFIMADDDNGLSHSFDRLVDGTANTLTVQGNKTALSKYTQLTANDEENITLDSRTSGNFTIGTLVAADLTTLTVKGGGNVVVAAAISGGTKVATVDASTATGNVDIDASTSLVSMTMTGQAGTSGTATFAGGLGADTITGTSQNDVILGGNGGDTIVAGVGDDTVTSGGGVDTVTLGAGTDTIIITAEGTTGYVTVTDFNAATSGENDEIEFDVSALNSNNLSDTQGTKVTGGITDAVVAYDGANALASNTAAIVFIKATATDYNSFVDVNADIDAANITLDNGGSGFAVGEGILFGFYDNDGGYASVGYLESDTADIFDNGNTYVEVARLTMTTTEWTAFDADNIDVV
jgi:hypothetical protein